MHRVCSIKGCEGKHQARGMCNRHYGRWYYGLDRDQLPLKEFGVRLCSIEGCARKHKAKGLCATHYMRQRRHGDPEHLEVLGVAPIGTRRIRPDGYVEVKTEDGQKHWPLEHRAVVEGLFGRPLATDEHVHHINGDRADNRPENLKVYTNDEHQHLHEHWKSWTQKRIELTCERCGASYTRKPSKAAESRFCSNACKMPAITEARRRKAAERRAAQDT